MNTVAEKAPLRAWPQVQESPRRAAARPLKKTSPEPLAIGLVPWPGMGQVVGSVTRAAGFPDMNTPCLSFEASGEANERSGGRQPLNPVSKGCDVPLWGR